MRQWWCVVYSWNMHRGFIVFFVMFVVIMFVFQILFEYIFCKITAMLFRLQCVKGGDSACICAAVWIVNMTGPTHGVSHHPWCDGCSCKWHPVWYISQDNRKVWFCVILVLCHHSGNHMITQLPIEYYETNCDPYSNQNKTLVIQMIVRCTAHISGSKKAIPDFNYGPSFKLLTV